MIRVIGTRGSGKTTKLLNIAAENGYVIVEPTAMMADYVRHMAIEKELNVNVINACEMLYRQHGVVHEKYLVDELGMFMASLGIVGYSDGLEAQDKLLKEREVIKKDGYNLQELWKRARAGEKLTEAELNFLLADCLDKRNILSE